MRVFSTAFGAAVLLAACASVPTPEPIVVTERAFAADGYETGIKASFVKYAAPDAIMFSPGPVNVHDYFGGRPDAAPDPNRPHLVWWPLWAGIAKSGDLGFTTGPYGLDDTRHGWYFTIWQRQDDGGWKWLLDAGVDADPANAPPQGAQVAYLPVATGGSASPDVALSEVVALEAAMARMTETGLIPAYAGHFAQDARVHTDGAFPATDEGSREIALKARPSTMQLKPGGGGASAAGDMAWTWEEADWVSDGTPGHGFVVRVWQKGAAGWQIVFDELVA